MPTTDLLDPSNAPVPERQGGPVVDGLESLAGRRVALIKNAWPSWHDMADLLGEMLTERHEGLETRDYQVPNGSAADPDLLKAIAAESDCAVVGLANCGSCTAWSFHDAMELSALGLPVVLVVTSEFVGLARAIAQAKSVDLPRVILAVNPETIPRPEALTAARESYDAIVAELTAAAAPSEQVIDVGVDRLLPSYPDEDAAQEDIHRRGLTDGLPVVLPTLARVDRMLASLPGIDPTTTIAGMPPSGFSVTYENLAVNAVMAGCSPEYLPVLVAAVRAMCDPQFNLNGISTTTGPSTPTTIVSGPEADRIGLNAGRGALGPGWRANASIGRTIRLLINNIGGARPGEVSKSIMGQPGRYALCFAENVAASPWEPLHETLGVEGPSAVTVQGATGTINVLTPRQDVEAMFTLFADSFNYLGNPNMVMGKGTVLVLISPGHARAMAAAGYGKAQVAEEIWKRAGVPVERFPLSARPDASYAFIEIDGLVYPVADPAHLFVVVVGGAEPTHATVIPGHPSSVPVTRAVG